jgi:cation diffusion facilitator CzcD-associated flavoprotein CzcO
VLREKLHTAVSAGLQAHHLFQRLLPAFNQPHVQLVTQAIERVTPQGLVTADGCEHPVDVLVCATGFDTVQLAAIGASGGARWPHAAAGLGRRPEAFHGLTWVARVSQPVPDAGPEHRHRPHIDAAVHRTRRARVSMQVA